MEPNYTHTLGLKAKSSKVDARGLYCIKKLTGLSLKIIKEKVERKDYLLLVDACELEDIYKINSLKRELLGNGIEVLLYRDNKEKTSEYFDNIERRASEIEQESDF